MLRSTGMALLERLLDVVDAQTPEMADSHLRVSLENYSSEAIAARERDLFELSPLALVASSEIARPHDYLARRAAAAVPADDGFS